MEENTHFNSEQFPGGKLVRTKSYRDLISASDSERYKNLYSEKSFLYNNPFTQNMVIISNFGFLRNRNTLHRPHYRLSNNSLVDAISLEDYVPQEDLHPFANENINCNINMNSNMNGNISSNISSNMNSNISRCDSRKEIDCNTISSNFCTISSFGIDDVGYELIVFVLKDKNENYHFLIIQASGEDASKFKILRPVNNIKISNLYLMDICVCKHPVFKLKPYSNLLLFNLKCMAEEHLIGSLDMKFLTKLKYIFGI